MTTHQEIERIVKRLQGFAPGIHFDHGHGGYRLYRHEGRGMSPRLPRGKFYLWLAAFEQGVEVGYRAKTDKDKIRWQEALDKFSEFYTTTSGDSAPSGG